VLKERQRTPLIDKKDAIKWISYFRPKKRMIKQILKILQDRGLLIITKDGILLFDGIENLVEKQSRGRFQCP